MSESFMQREWSRQEGKLPGFSTQNPFGPAILKELKKIELRTWGTHYKGWVVIHAGKKWYGDIPSELGKRLNVDQVEGLKKLKEFIRRLELSDETSDYHFMSLLGVARLVRCAKFSSEERYEELKPLHRSNAAWEKDEYGWLFEDVYEFPQAVEGVRGYPGLFPVDLSLLPVEAIEFMESINAARR